MSYEKVKEHFINVVGLDERITKTFTIGGSLNSTVNLSLAELEKHAAFAEWIDVCNG
ncbi:hypothetical protein D3C76_461800 [compost metagenome]